MSNTLADYLRSEFAEGKIDFSIRALVHADRVTFYIHPSGKDGKTWDFEVKGNQLETMYPKELKIENSRQN